MTLAGAMAKVWLVHIPQDRFSEAGKKMSGLKYRPGACYLTELTWYKSSQLWSQSLNIPTDCLQSIAQHLRYHYGVALSNNAIVPCYQMQSMYAPRRGLVRLSLSTGSYDRDSIYYTVILSCPLFHNFF